MRKAGHPLRQRARPAPTSRQIRGRATIVARRVGLALIFLGAVLGIARALLVSAFDGVGVLAVLVVLVGYGITLFADDIAEQERRPW